MLKFENLVPKKKKKSIEYLNNSFFKLDKIVKEYFKYIESN